MAFPNTRVSPGEFISIKASDWNSFCRSINAAKQPLRNAEVSAPNYSFTDVAPGDFISQNVYNSAVSAIKTTPRVGSSISISSLSGHPIISAKAFNDLLSARNDLQAAADEYYYRWWQAQQNNNGGGGGR